MRGFTIRDYSCIVVDRVNRSILERDAENQTNLYAITQVTQSSNKEKNKKWETNSLFKFEYEEIRHSVLTLTPLQEDDDQMESER